MKSFFEHLETIGKAILTGIEFAAPIALKLGAAAEPELGPIFSEVGQVITALEAKGVTLSPQEVQQVVNAVAANSVLKAAGA